MRFLVILFVLLLPAVAFAETPTEYVKAQTVKVTDVLKKPDSKKRAKTLDKLLQSVIDFRELAARSLGEHWTARTPDEQKQFLDLLQELLQANYEGKLEGKVLGTDYKVSYDSERLRDDKAVVKTTIVTSEESKPVDYKLIKKGKVWSIFDVVIDDISLEETYRDSYVEIIKKEGWASLIQKMKDRAKEVRDEVKAEKAKTVQKG